MASNTALERAAQILGSKAKLAAALDVTPGALTKWAKRIPAERVIDIERATDGRVTRQELRPDLYPAEPGAA